MCVCVYVRITAQDICYRNKQTDTYEYRFVLMCEDPTDDIEILVSDDAARQFLTLYKSPCDLSQNEQYSQRNTLKEKVRLRLRRLVTTAHPLVASCPRDVHKHTYTHTHTHTERERERERCGGSQWESGCLCMSCRDDNMCLTHFC